MKKVKDFARKNKSQCHLCICDTDLFDGSITNGVYGFPHQGKRQLISFWRSVASMYNIGPSDMIFIYRRQGQTPGCGEIHGPFKIYSISNKPVIYYDPESPNFPMKVAGTIDCSVRFLFQNFNYYISSIADNFELIKKYETKQIWGYRHPAVMNIGAARKKSATSFSYKQTMTLLEMMEDFGEIRKQLSQKIPLRQRVDYCNSLTDGSDCFPLNDEFLLSADNNFEAFLYAYILRGIKTSKSTIHNGLMEDFSEINDEMLLSCAGKRFKDMAINAMMEVIISPHLQDELDIVIMDEEDTNILFFEIKQGAIDQNAVYQTQKYLDLLKTVFPERNIFANIIGTQLDDNITFANGFEKLIKLVVFLKGDNGKLRFKSRS